MNLASAYGSPYDIHGVGQWAINLHGQPAYNGIWIAPADTTLYNNPYEINLASPANRAGQYMEGSEVRDSVFTPTELERLLRWHNADSPALPSRILDLTKIGAVEQNVGGAFDVGPLQTSTGFSTVDGQTTTTRGIDATVYTQQYQLAGRRRAMVTTESWDLPVPNIAAPADLRQTIQNALGYEPQGVVDVLAARMADENNWTNLQSAANLQLVNHAIQFYLSPEMRAGQRFNLNRPFGDGRDDPNNQNFVIDEPLEVLPIDQSGNVVYQYPTDDPTDRQVVPIFDPANGELLNPSLPIGSPLNSLHVRQIYARHLYVLAMTICEREFQVTPNAGETLEQARARVLAQWAVNVVDYRDADHVMTYFEYDVDPFTDNDNDGHPWDVDGLNTQADRDTVVPYRGLVWGAERPELLITETMALHDHRVVESNQMNQPYAQYARPVGSLLVELYNPQSPADAFSGDVHEITTNNAAQPFGVDLAKRAIGNGNQTSLVWRLALASPPGDLQDDLDPRVELPRAVNPNEIGALAYFTPDLEPNDIFDDLRVSGAVAAPIRFVAARGQQNLIVMPNHYALVGSASKTRRDEREAIFIGKGNLNQNAAEKDYPMRVRFPVPNGNNVLGSDVELRDRLNVEDLRSRGRRKPVLGRANVTALRPSCRRHLDCRRTA